jgi:hypothetical protein
MYKKFLLVLYPFETVRIRICIKQSDPDPYQIEKQDPDQTGLDSQHCFPEHALPHLAGGCPPHLRQISCSLGLDQMEISANVTKVTGLSKYIFSISKQQLHTLNCAVYMIVYRCIFSSTC